MRSFGVISRGVRMPVIKKGDDLVNVVTTNLFKALDDNHIEVNDKDVICVTESIVARSQGNFASLSAISKDVKNKMGNGLVGLLFPILSRNRFSLILEGIAKGVDKLIIQLSYPQDEVGNPLIDQKEVFKFKQDFHSAIYSEDEFIAKLGHRPLHPFTGVDYVELYKSISSNIEIIFSNDPCALLKYTKKIICADIHTRESSKETLLDSGATKVITLAEILNSSVDGSGYNELYGVLGSNYSHDDLLKLFPRDGQIIVDTIQKNFLEKYHKHVEVLIYGDGAFKDPQAKIWELADPVVSPFYTKGLVGTPHELKFKFIADSKLQDLDSVSATKEIQEIIHNKKIDSKNAKESLGTTPRNLTDLLGSLADLTSGSGDKGTPVIYIQGYFDDFSKE